MSTFNPLRTAVLLGILALVPLILIPNLFFYFDITPKIVLLLAGTAVALALGRPAEQPSRETPWFKLLLAAQAGSLLLSTIFSMHRALSVTGTNWRRFGLVTHLALLTYVWLLSSERPAHILRTLSLSGSLAALYGIAQYFGWDPWIPKQAYHIGEGIWTIVRPPGPLGHADYFSVYLVSVVFAGIALASGESLVWWRRAGGATVALASAAILLSGSRAAILALCAGAIALLIERRPRITALRAAIAAGLLAAMVAFYFSPAGVLARARTRWFREDPRGGGRLLLWRDTLKMAAPRLPTGYGPETYSSQFPRFQSASLAREFPNRYYESPHNIFLDALISQGTSGLLILGGFAALGFWAPRNGAQEQEKPGGAAPLGRSRPPGRLGGCSGESSSRARGPGAAPTRLSKGVSTPQTGVSAPREAGFGFFSSQPGAGLLAILVANQFLSFTMPTAMMFYVTVALLCSAAPCPRVPASPRLRVPAAILLLAAAFSLAWSDYWLARTKASLESGAVGRAMEDYRRLRRWAPPGMDTDLWYSRGLIAAAAKANAPVFQPAFEAAARAAENSEERPNAWYNLAAFYALRNDFPNIERCLRAAMDWAPSWYKPRWMLAQALRQAGRLEEAEALARQAVDLNGGKDPEVARTYEEIRAARQK